jgi:hypothetical protein
MTLREYVGIQAYISMNTIYDIALDSELVATHPTLDICAN